MFVCRFKIFLSAKLKNIFYAKQNCFQKFVKPKLSGEKEVANYCQTLNRYFCQILMNKGLCGNCTQRPGIADGRAIVNFLPEQKIVNEQIVEIMILSSKENVKPELLLNSEQKTSAFPSPPAIDNTNVVCQGGYF